MESFIESFNQHSTIKYSKLNRNSVTDQRLNSVKNINEEDNEFNPKKIYEINEEYNKNTIAGMNQINENSKNSINLKGEKMLSSPNRKKDKNYLEKYDKNSKKSKSNRLYSEENEDFEDGSEDKNIHINNIESENENSKKDDLYDYNYFKFDKDLEQKKYMTIQKKNSLNIKGDQINLDKFHSQKNKENKK